MAVPRNARQEISWHCCSQLRPAARGGLRKVLPFSPTPTPQAEVHALKRCLSPGQRARARMSREELELVDVEKQMEEQLVEQHKQARVPLAASPAPGIWYRMRLSQS